MRSQRFARGIRPLFALLSLCFVLGCSVPVASSLDEDDANRIVLSLSHGAIGANKEVDPQSEGKFRVLVLREDVAGALSTLREESLPRPKVAGLLESMGKGGLVPSAQSEHAQYLVGLGGELERSLLSIDGIRVARVHLNVPVKEAFATASKERASASVLIVVSKLPSPLSEQAVQKLVAGSIPSLDAANVAVVFAEHPAHASKADVFAQIGPIAVSNGSRSLVVSLFAGAFLLLMVVSLASLFLYAKLARTRAELEASKKGT